MPKKVTARITSEGRVIIKVSNSAVTKASAVAKASSMAVPVLVLC